MNYFEPQGHDDIKPHEVWLRRKTRSKMSIAEKILELNALGLPKANVGGLRAVATLLRDPDYKPNEREVEDWAEAIDDASDILQIAVQLAKESLAKQAGPEVKQLVERLVGLRGRIKGCLPNSPYLTNNDADLINDAIECTRSLATKSAEAEGRVGLLKKVSMRYHGDQNCYEAFIPCELGTMQFTGAGESPEEALESLMANFDIIWGWYVEKRRAALKGGTE